MSIQHDDTGAGVLTFKVAGSGNYSITWPATTGTGALTNNGYWHRTRHMDCSNTCSKQHQQRLDSHVWLSRSNQYQLGLPPRFR
jgi:hypothetical protein